MHVLIVRFDCIALGAEKVVGPDANQRQQYRHVLFEWSIPEMLIHLVCAI